MRESGRPQAAGRRALFPTPPLHESSALSSQVLLENDDICLALVTQQRHAAAPAYIALPGRWPRQGLPIPRKVTLKRRLPEAKKPATESAHAEGTSAFTLADEHDMMDAMKGENMRRPNETDSQVCDFNRSCPGYAGASADSFSADLAWQPARRKCRLKQPTGIRCSHSPDLRANQ